jgi:hypothetical protein
MSWTEARQVREIRPVEARNEIHAAPLLPIGPVEVEG